MDHLYLILLGIGTGLVGLWGFFWALNNGQFDDPKGNAERILREKD
jgi:cbb3-type cytochrome oxidase maturation protein